MRRYTDSVANRATGQAVPNAQVSVLMQDGTPAQLYSDNGVTTLSQPVLTNGLGLFYFYVSDGTYTLTIQAPGSTLQTIPSVEIYEDATTAALAQRAVLTAVGVTPPVVDPTGAVDGQVLSFSSGKLIPVNPSASAPVQSVSGKTGAVALTSSDVGLGSVNNTPDASKPVSTAQAVAIAAKYDASNPSNFVNSAGAASAAPVQSVAGKSGAVSLAKADVGLANIDNTSDVNKPVSTAQATALALKTNLTDLQAASGSTITHYQRDTNALLMSLQQKLSQYVNLLDYADLVTSSPYDGSTLWDAALDKALSTGFCVYVPRGSYILAKPHYITNSGQRIVGEGMAVTTFIINAATFAVGTPPSGVTTQGVIVVMNTGGGTGSVDETFAGIGGVSFIFNHASTASRAALTQFPYAIATQAGRPWIGDILIKGAYNGIYTDGKSGGLIGGNWEIGAYNQGWYTDGSYDTKTVNFVRFWPHGCNTTIYYDGTTLGATFGADDGVQMAGLFTIGVKSQTIVGTKSSGGTANGPLTLNIGVLAFDTASNAFVHNAGNILVGTGYFSLTDGSKFAIQMNCASANSGSFIMDTLYLLSTGTAPSTPTGTIQTTSSNVGLIKISKAFIRGTLAANVSTFTHAGGYMDIEGVHFDQGSNVARTAPFIAQTGGRILLDDIRFPGIGTGSGNAVTIATNDSHIIKIPNTGGWGVSIPGTISNGNYTIGAQLTTVPTAAFGGGSATLAYGAQQTCTYTITNNFIRYSVDISGTWTNPGSSTGNFYIYTNLPYPPIETTSCGLGKVDNVTLTGYYQIGFSMPVGGTYLDGWISASGSTAGHLNGSNFSNGSQWRFQISGSYKA